MEIIISSSPPKKADQLLPQKTPGKADSNFSAHHLCFANGKADGQVKPAHQAKARPTSQQYRYQTSQEKLSSRPSSSKILQKTLIFFLNILSSLGCFLLMSTYKTITVIARFSLFSSYWVRRFFSQ